MGIEMGIVEGWYDPLATRKYNLPVAATAPLKSNE